MKKYLMGFLKDENGASLAEYGILVALIAVVCIIAVTNVGVKIKAALNNIVTYLTVSAPTA